MSAAGPAPQGMRIGFVGAGRMGRQMVRRLLAAGHEVTVLELSEAARQTLTEDGAKATTEVAEVASAEVIGVCVHTDAQVRDACLGSGLIEAMSPGSALVVHTTCSPATVEAIGERAEPFGVAVVDAGISGGPHDIEAGHLTLYVGGTDDDVQRVRPVLEAYGDPILHLGPRGTGQRIKLLNNAVFAANIGLLAQAVAVGEQLGLEEKSLLQGLRHGSGSSRALDGVAATGSVAGFAGAVREFLGKDLAVVREITAGLGVRLGALDDAHEVLAGLLAPASAPAPSDQASHPQRSGGSQ